MTAERRRLLRESKGVRVGTLALAVAAAFGALRLVPPLQYVRAPFAAIGTAPSLGVVASGNAFGRSNNVKLRLALPGDSLEFPIEVHGGVAPFTYRWVPVDTATPAPLEHRALAGAMVVTPAQPGLYRLALIRDDWEELVPEPIVGVMVPFESKRFGLLNGYRIGTYLSERGRGAGAPTGFLQVGPEMVDLPITTHLKLGDFITRDAQADVWPKYVALDPRLLDKLELVFGRIAKWRGEEFLPSMALDVHSGFRTPAYNAGVRRAARDSRHQYGDAADIAVDANRDGRVTVTDEILVARAVDEIEEEHPDLVGGLGLYVGRRYPNPYVHIDARGKRSRW